MSRNGIDYKVFGMRRSGNHPILHWMAEHFDKPCWFLNDVECFDCPEPRGKDYIKAGELGCFRVPLVGDNFWEEHKDVLIQTYEDYDLSDLDWRGNLHRVGDSETERSVLIIRSPYNLMASRGQKLLGSNPEHHYILPVSRMSIERWKQHAKEAIGETDYLHNKVVVIYDRWVTDESYRRDIEKQMMLPNINPEIADSTLDRVVMAGSSFSKMDKDGSAKSMSVGKRWQVFRNAPWFAMLFDKRTVELAERLGFESIWRER